MAEPPLLLGADHESETCVLPAVATSPVGAAGCVIWTGSTGVAETEADADPVPAAFVADTLNW